MRGEWRESYHLKISSHSVFIAKLILGTANVFGFQRELGGNLWFPGKGAYKPRRRVQRVVDPDVAPVHLLSHPFHGEGRCAFASGADFAAE